MKFLITLLTLTTLSSAFAGTVSKFKTYSCPQNVNYESKINWVNKTSDGDEYSAGDNKGNTITKTANFVSSSVSGQQGQLFTVKCKYKDAKNDMKRDYILNTTKCKLMNSSKSCTQGSNRLVKCEVKDC